MSFAKRGEIIAFIVHSCNQYVSAFSAWFSVHPRSTFTKLSGIKINTGYHACIIENRFHVWNNILYFLCSPRAWNSNLHWLIPSLSFYWLFWTNNYKIQLTKYQTAINIWNTWCLFCPICIICVCWSYAFWMQKGSNGIN